MIIGYTTGVFDMFHIGHLNILKRAKEQCDYLIVGVSTDELVQSYKNKLPIIPYAERSAIVEAIKYVDKVVPQKNRDKIAAFNEFKFNKMFVGDDWKGKPLFVEVEEYLNKNGAEVVYFPYTQGTSAATPDLRRAAAAVRRDARGHGGLLLRQLDRHHFRSRARAAAGTAVKIPLDAVGNSWYHQLVPGKWF